MLGSTTEWFGIPVIMVSTVRPLIALPCEVRRRGGDVACAGVRDRVTYQDAIVRAGGQPVALRRSEKRSPISPRRSPGSTGCASPAAPTSTRAGTAEAEIHPAVYGVDARHDAFDLAIARAAVELRMPILAICRGHQVLNVALGGTLIQHLGDERTSDHRFQYHSVELQAGCRAGGWRWAPTGRSAIRYTTRPSTASPDGMVVTGRADDGTIEAMESVDGWVVSVQWHPEDDAHERIEQQRLFDAFVAACLASSRA